MFLIEKAGLGDRETSTYMFVKKSSDKKLTLSGKSIGKSRMRPTNFGVSEFI